MDFQRAINCPCSIYSNDNQKEERLEDRSSFASSDPMLGSKSF